MPGIEAVKLEASVLGDQGNLDRLYKALANTKIQDAQASYPSDREMILDKIDGTVGFDILNKWVNGFLRDWFHSIVRGALEAVALDQTSASPDAKEVTDRLTKMAEFFYRNRELQEAIELLTKVATIRELSLGSDHPETAKSYNNIGLVLSKKGDFKMALQHHRKAIAILEQVHGSDNVDMAYSYAAAGNALYNMRNYVEALDLHHKALAIREALLGSTDPSTASSRMHIGMLLGRQGRYSEALVSLGEARDVYESRLGRDNPQTATLYQRIGDVLLAKGNEGGALLEYQRALAIREVVLDQNHPDLVESVQTVKALKNSRRGDT